MPQHDDHKHDAIHDQGLQFDLRTLMARRRALGLFGGAAAGATALALVGCSDGDSRPAETSTSLAQTPGPAGTTQATSSAAAVAPTALVSPIPTSATTPTSACVAEIPGETAGPFPGNGSNGPNALTQSGMVRSDIRSSIGTSQATAPGIPLAVELTIVDTSKGCAPMPGAAVYAWHCDREGRYSMYSAGVTNENFLRGVQAADANGKVRFQTIFPGAYLGRWPHIHFEVYPSLALATSSNNKIATSQLALPDEACKAAYAATGYETSARNHPRTTLQGDGVFRDGWDLQMAQLAGSNGAGYTASLTVGI